MPAKRAPAENGAGGGLREESRESRWEAAPAVVCVIALQVLLALVSRQGDWKLWSLPWWVWLVPVAPELVVLLPLAFKSPRHQLEQMGKRRLVAVSLFALIGLANGLALVALIGSLLSGEETNGAELLFKAVVVWTTNVLAYGLWYWAFDRGGPVRRLEPNPPLPDFQFPQLENPELAPKGWQPELFDYLYVSFTNAIAFSPTDAMPLTRRAKLLMLSESAVSAVTVLLVAARSVNILN